MTTQALSTDTKVLAKQQRTAFDRLAEMEKTVQMIIDGSNRALQTLGQRLEALEARYRAQSELVTAAVDLLGREAIDVRVLVNRDAAATAQGEREKQELELLKAQGIAVPADVVGEKSLVTGFESQPNGTVKVPGYTQAFMENLPQELKNLIVGKVVGDVVTLPGDAGTFKVEQIFDIVPPKAPEAPDATKAEA